jgi:hypothetical protein
MNNSFPTSATSATSAVNIRQADTDCLVCPEHVEGDCPGVGPRPEQLGECPLQQPLPLGAACRVQSEIRNPKSEIDLARSPSAGLSAEAPTADLLYPPPAPDDTPTAACLPSDGQVPPRLASRTPEACAAACPPAAARPGVFCPDHRGTENAEGGGDGGLDPLVAIVMREECCGYARRRYSPSERRLAAALRAGILVGLVCAGIGHASSLSAATDGQGRNRVARSFAGGATPQEISVSETTIKLAVLQRTWKLASKGSASRARAELRQRAARLGGTAHNQAEAIHALIARCSPVIRELGFEGLVRLLKED